MPVGVRQLTVLGEFKPFGLVAEALDGKLADPVAADYSYFLFDPAITGPRDDGDDLDSPSSSLSSTGRGDHELFIRGNRIIWSTGTQVRKRFTLPSPVIMACWCRLTDISEALLCVLQVGSLTMYNISGEAVSIPLQHTTTSIWPLPFGLVLEQAADGYMPTYAPYSSTSPLFNARDISRPKIDFNHLNASDSFVKVDGATTSSHTILGDPLEEPQPIFIDERGKLNIMTEFDERTIWTSDCIPLMASYNKGKVQHSLWVAETVNSNLEIENSKLTTILPAGVILKRYAFRKIWQGKGAQIAASKVFLGTDDDGDPLICFLLQEQKKLLSVRLHTVEINNEILYDIKPDMSWSIAAIGAAPVSITRPGVKVGLLTFKDIIVLAPENTLFLYSGKQCLCKYVLPPILGRSQVSHMKPLETPSAFIDFKINGLADAVGGRINLVINNGQVFRCALRRSPSSTLANDCITALAEGLASNFYNYFLGFLWCDEESASLAKADVDIDSEWESFRSALLKMCGNPKLIFPGFSNLSSCSSWDFLINSQFHKNYCKSKFVNRISSATLGLCLDGGQSQEPSFYAELLVEALDSLHAVYESLKLDNLRRRDLGLLVLLLCDIAKFLGEDNYLDHYIRDFPGLSKTLYSTSMSGKTPPSLFRWLESCLQHGCNSASSSDLPPLIHKDGCSVVSWARKIVSFYSLLCGAEQLGEKLSSGVYCKVATGSHSTCEELTVLAMVGERFGLKQLDLLPAGASLPLRHALDRCRESPPVDWPAAAYVLIGREDLAFLRSAHSNKSKESEPRTNMNLISMSTPYMLHLHPVTIPSSTSDTLETVNATIEDSDSVDGSIIDGMEHIFNSSTQLRYGRDLRLNEVRRLLCSARPVAIQTSVNPTASDQDLQQAQLWQLAQRTTALPMGRGAFTLATTSTLLTEALTVPKLVLAGQLPAQQNATVNLDPNIRNIQELKSWPEFHNAVASGLRLAPLQGKMSRTWIIYNKPEEPNVIHAGLLFALGLHGYLRVLTITDIYQYLSQEHESTTVGLMLGLAASYRGTMQPAISKSLYVHIPARHPSSFPELELPTVLQSAALLSVGLLYEGSAHPQTLQTLLSEIGRRSGGDNVLEREGYAVSAGFSLGLVALGRGKDTIGFMTTLIDRLFQYIGGKEPPKQISLILMPSTDDHNRIAGQMIDGSSINVDVTAPGAIIALTLMYLKTESEVMVARLSIPQSHYDLQYVRPDFIMLRVIAQNLIMWSRILPSEDWIQSQIPEIIQNSIKDIGDELADIDEMDAQTFVQAYVNIVAGACVSLGLRFAGTKSGSAQELLYNYALYFLNEIKPGSFTSRKTFPKGLSQYVDRGTLETCLHLIVLSLSVVMAGSGHLETFRLLRFLRSRNSADGNANYGTQMAVSLAIGFLFLGGGMRTFSTGNSSVAVLLLTLYPRLPSGPNDNRCHIQAFRHLYVLATESRWIQTVDVDTGLPVYAPLEITMKETEHYAETSFCEVTPCILPERAILNSVRVCGPRYWPQAFELVPEDKPWWNSGDKNDPFNSGIIYIKRKVGACSYVDDPIGCQSLLSRAMRKVFGLTSPKACATSLDGRNAVVTIDQLVSTFSSDPSLIAFAQLCCDPSWNGRSDVDFQEFCLQVLFECVSKDRPALLQVYLSLYTMVVTMADQIVGGTSSIEETVFLSSLKLAQAYSEALLSGRLLTSRGAMVQSTFLGSLRKRVEELLNHSPVLQTNLFNYLKSGTWPSKESHEGWSSTLLSLYLQWYGIPAPSVITATVQKVKALSSSSPIPLLQLVLPGTRIDALGGIHKFWLSI